MEYRVHWRSKWTGATGHGDYSNEMLARATLAWAEMEYAKREHRNDKGEVMIEHWVEPKLAEGE